MWGFSAAPDGAADAIIESQDGSACRGACGLYVALRSTSDVAREYGVGVAQGLSCRNMRNIEHSGSCHDSSRLTLETLQTCKHAQASTHLQLATLRAAAARPRHASWAAGRRADPQARASHGRCCCDRRHQGLAGKTSGARALMQRHRSIVRSACSPACRAFTQKMRSGHASNSEQSDRAICGNSTTVIMTGLRTC